MESSSDRLGDAYCFDLLAPYYQEYYRTRVDYLAAVDRLVIENISGEASSLLDVGAGDGLRAERIARERRLRTFILAEPSAVMVNYCRQRGATDVWLTAAETLPRSERQFDVIICLWNVLGHVREHASRLEALRRMRALLNEGGQIFLDVNNRYNARAYGWLATLGRMLFDRVKPAPENGDVTYNWQVDGRVIKARGHVFAPREITNLIEQSGLRIQQRFVLDYQMGCPRRTILGGQLLFELRRY